MLSLSRRLGVKASPATVAEYWHHLFPQPGLEIQTMCDLVPNDLDGVDEAYQFQRHVRDKFQLEGDRVIGYKFLLPTDPMLKNLRAVAPHVCPFFDRFCHESGATIKMEANRVQQVELSLLVELACDPGASTPASTSSASSRPPASAFSKQATATAPNQSQPANTNNNEINKSGGKNVMHQHPLPEWVAAVRPCLELTGSRFPFFAPHLPGYVSDLTSHVGLIQGPRVSREQMEAIDPVRFNLDENGGVLTRGDEPVQVGYPRQAFGGVASAVPHAVELARAHCGGETDVARGLLVSIGSLGRTAAKEKTTFRGHFGPLGIVEVHLE